MKTRISLILGAFLAACSSDPVVPNRSPKGPVFEQFTPNRTAYRLSPGDQIEVTLYGAPDLNRTVTVGPDGRISMPMVSPFMVANLTLAQAQQVIQQNMSGALVDPRLDVSIASYAPQRVFVGGQVGQPGAIELPGQVDPLQAIIMAGGFTDQSDMKQVLLLRRMENGQVQTFSFDVKQGMYNPQLAQFGPLQKFDVLYVPKTRIAQQNLFMQQYIRNALPIDFSFYYDIGDRNNR